jgi:hypothetical protein
MSLPFQSTHFEMFYQIFHNFMMVNIEIDPTGEISQEAGTVFLDFLGNFYNLTEEQTLELYQWFHQKIKSEAFVEGLKCNNQNPQA